MVKKFKPTKAVEQAAIDHAMQEMEATGREACGVVIREGGKQVYVPCRNMAVDDKGKPALNTFILHYVDFANASDRGEILCIVHSHVHLAPEPSNADLASMARESYPWMIVSVPSQEVKVHDVPKVPIPLLGREYEFGVSDCYALARDYYASEHGIVLPNPQRTMDELEQAYSLWNDYEAVGFKNMGTLDEVEPLPGDGLLFHMGGSKGYNHCAVYLGDNMILHHCYRRPSTKDVFGSYWRKRVSVVLRHPDVAKKFQS